MSRRYRFAFEVLEDRITPSAAQFIDALYEDFLQRNPSQPEVADYVRLLQTGTSPAAITALFANSAEHIDLVTRSDYTTLLGREPAAAELTAWRTARQNGLTDREQLVGFLASGEYFAAQGGAGDGWLEGVYSDVLGRDPDDSGRAAFLPLNLQSASVRAQVGSIIVFSTEASNIAVNQTYVTMLQRNADPTGLNFWTAELKAKHSLSAIQASIAASPEYISVRATDLTITPSSLLTTSPLITLNLPPIDLNLLGLSVQTTDPIQVTVSAVPGDGALLGNILTTAANLVNLEGVNNALNTVLDSVVTLVNSVDLNVSGVGAGVFDSATAGTTPVLDLFVAPVHLNLLGAVVDTSPIHLTITAHSGEGLVLGNVVTALTDLFNPPLPDSLDLDFVNSRLQQLLADLNAQIPGIGSSPTTPSTPPLGAEQILRLTVPPIDLNLLGLVLETSQIQVNADAVTGDGKLLGNVLTTLLNTLGATPESLAALSDNLNGLLAKIVGVLNASSLILAPGAVGSLSQVLQQLALPNLVNPTGTASAPILNLAIASTDGVSPPVNVDLLGLVITTSNIHAQLLAETGEGQVLGNLLYNVANLLNPGGTLNLLAILNALAL
jgi:hypothetical protein